MKTLFGFVFLLVSANALAQFTVAPFGAGSAVNAPIGDDKKNQCSNNRCGFELVIKPFCFGTNLRAYPVQIQLDPTKQVKSNIVFHGSNNKKDEIQVTFPANMTYASAGSRINCSFKEDDDMSKTGSHQMACYIPWLNKSYTYTLKEWLTRANPGPQTEYNRYSGVGLPATLVSGQGDDIDKDITCLYRFTKHRGSLIRSSVSCYFPSRLPDLHKAIGIVKDGKEVKDAEVVAYTNMIKIKFKQPISSLTEQLAVRHGKINLETPPKHSVSFSQPASATTRLFFNPWGEPEKETTTTWRNIAVVKEQEGFDESNAYQSFTAQVKFPGMEGFCGGYYSPLMLFFDEKLPKFSGVSAFPLYNMPEGTPVNWPEQGAPGYFLAVLKDGEKKISSYKQLFGQTNEFDNGFEALKVYDENGDGQIDHNDSIWNSLYLWNDANGDGHSQPKEILPLKAKNVTSIKLKYTTRDATNFDNRARVREKGSFTYLKNGKEVKAQVWDVWFSPLEQN